jgi:hypothetical protein
MANPRLNAELLNVPKGEAAPDLPSPEREPDQNVGWVSLTMRVEPEIYEEFREIAFRRRRKMADLFRQALKLWLKEQGRGG